ncbi:MAG TPA: hypothetical protein VGX03_06035, partial [Candidatus Binatia bacterium]|nr:hypothetical protein [Candidatus Binatia bacterium]
GCTTGVCDKSLACSNYGNFYEYAPEGPNYFYANCKKLQDGTTVCDPGCKGFQPGIPVTCNVVAKETCGNSTDGVGPDNCYGRATQNRSWYAGPSFAPSPGVTTSGNTKRLPVGTYIYRDDEFKNPGGKLIQVQARLETAGQATLRVELKNSAYQVIYTFPKLPALSTTFVNKVFQSTIVVTPPVSQVILINEGPGVIIVQTVIARD